MKISANAVHPLQERFLPVKKEKNNKQLISLASFCLNSLTAIIWSAALNFGRKVTMVPGNNFLQEK